MEDNKQEGKDSVPLEEQLSGMSPEQLKEALIKESKARKDQEGFNHKLKDEIEQLKNPKIDPVKEEEPKGKPAPTADVTQADTIAVATLVQKGLSGEEIKEAQSLVGTSLGNDIVSVAESAAFQAQLKQKREAAKSEDMKISDLSGLQAPTTDDQFMQLANSGQIDLTDPTHEARYKKLAVKNFRLS